MGIGLKRSRARYDPCEAIGALEFGEK